MTTYILAGGADRSNQGYWQNLAKVMPNKKSLRVLSCMFARVSPEGEREDWQALFDSFAPYFKTAFGDDGVFELADAENLAAQIEQADVIYLHGGQTETLMEVFGQYEDLGQRFAGKIIVGSSAGAQLISKKFWKIDTQKIGTGLGLVDCSIVVHYDSDFGSDDLGQRIDWDKAVSELQDVIGDNIVTKIREGEFAVFEVE